MMSEQSIEAVENYIAKTRTEGGIRQAEYAQVRATLEVAKALQSLSDRVQNLVPRHYPASK